MDRATFDSALRADMRANGFTPPDDFDWDGGFKRFSTHPSKSWDDAGFVLIHWDERPNAVYGDHRQGSRFVFVPDGQREMSKDDLEAFRAKVKADEQRRAAERKARQTAASARAGTFYFGAQKAGTLVRPPKSHPYLKKKLIPPVGALMHTVSRRLVIPITDMRGNVRSLQTIYKDGTKRYAPGCPIKGYFLLIGRTAKEIQPDDRVWVCEGWATGVSVMLASNDPVFVAFDAGNLAPVARKVRNAYGVALRIVIAGDNDIKTPGNPGVTAAIEAASAPNVRGMIAIPDPVIPGEPADWNDVWCAKGAEATRALLEAAVEPPLTPSVTKRELEERQRKLEEVQRDLAAKPEDPKAWMAELLVDDKSRIKAIEANCVTLLKRDPALAGLIRWNSFSAQLELAHEPPWQTSTARYPCQLADKDRASLLTHLQMRGIPFSRRHIDEALRVVPEWAAYDPLTEMLESFDWDGIPRLDSWMIECCEADDTPYVRAVSRAFMIGAVARALDPGVKMDSTLVIEGRQGTGKSTLCRVLAVRPEFASDAFPNLRTEKYPEMRLRGCWIMEVPELSGVSKADIQQVKEFLSRHEDRARDPYSPVVESRPRRCVFVATTNQSEYLRDPTGARRFWPVQTGRIAIGKLRNMVTQLWAEAIVAYRAGEDWHLSAEMSAAQREAAEERQVHDPLEELIGAYIRENRITAISPAEIVWDLMAGRSREAAAKFGITEAIRISAALTNMGWVRVARSKWCRPQLGSKVDVWVERDLVDKISGAKRWDGARSRYTMTADQLRLLRFHPDHYTVPPVPETDRHLAPVPEGGDQRSFHDLH